MNFLGKNHKNHHNKPSKPILNVFLGHFVYNEMVSTIFETIIKMAPNIASTGRITHCGTCPDVTDLVVLGTLGKGRSILVPF